MTSWVKIMDDHLIETFHVLGDRRMNIVITGHKRHGKDTLCEYLGLPWAASSVFACKKFIFNVLRDRYKYKTKEECFNDRHNHRKEWFDLIVTYNTPDLSKMGSEIFESYDVYCGIRNIDELNALKEKNLIDLCIWVDASQRCEPESADSITVTADDCDWIISNNKGLSDLQSKAYKLRNLLPSGHRHET